MTSSFAGIVSPQAEQAPELRNNLEIEKGNFFVSNMSRISCQKKMKKIFTVAIVTGKRRRRRYTTKKKSGNECQRQLKIIRDEFIQLYL